MPTDIHAGRRLFQRLVTVQQEDPDLMIAEIQSVTQVTDILGALMIAVTAFNDFIAAAVPDAEQRAEFLQKQFLKMEAMG